MPNQKDFDEEKITVLTMIRQKAIQNMHSASTDAHREKSKPIFVYIFRGYIPKFKF